MKNEIVESPTSEDTKKLKLKLKGASFKTKALRSVSILIVIVIAVSIFLFIIEYKSKAKSDRITLYEEIMNTIISEINNWIEIKTQILKTLQLAVIDWEQKPEFYLSLFKQTLIADKNILSIYFVHTNSIKLIGYKIDAKDLISVKVNNLQNSQWYQNAVFSQKKIVTEPFFYNRTNKIAVTIAYPIIKENKTIGVIAIDCDINNLIKILNDNSVTQKIFLYLMTQEGMYVNHEDTTRILKFNDILFAQDIFTTEKSFIVNQTKSVKFIDTYNIFYLSQKLTTMPLILFLYGNISNIYDSLFSIIIRIIIRILFVLVAIIFVISVILSILTKPLSPMVLKVKDLAEGGGDLSERIKSNAKDEIGMLAHYFNEFLNYFNTMFIDLKTQAEKMMDSQVSVSASVQETSASVHEISASLNQINDNVKYQNSQINQSVNSVGKLITDFKTLTETIFSQTSLIEQSTASIQELTKSMDTVAEIS